MTDIKKLRDRLNEPRKLKVFFDLENTLIRHWTDRELCNQDQIKKIIETNIKEYGDNIEYGIYSYALWCDGNVDEFEENILGVIEKYYNISINKDLIIPVHEMCKASVLNHHALDKCDVGTHCMYYNKVHSFIDWVNTQGSGDYILVDDTVKHYASWEQEHNNSMVFFINPLELRDS